MEKITYTEIFYSLQGEGRWAGVPSVFFRTYGCNFRCKKFGRTDDFEGHNPEVVEIIQQILHRDISLYVIYIFLFYLINVKK